MRTSESRSPIAETESLLEAVHDATLAIKVELGAELDRQGMSVPMFWMLHRVASDGPMNLRQVATACWVSSANVSAAVDDLVQAGLVSRERAQDDRREVVLSATPRGRTIHAGVWRRASALFAERLRNTSPADFSTASRVLQKIASPTPESPLPRVVVVR